MTELKTLKDLQKEYEWNYDTYKALKAEAVKCLAHGLGKYTNPGEVSSKIIQNFIDFFGFNEEDLK